MHETRHGGDGMQHHEHDSSGTYPTDVAGLPPAHPTPEVNLSDGDELDLRIAPMTQRIGDVAVRRLAYNGSVPGRTLRVRQGSEIVVHVTNDGDVSATVHWHGLRLENRTTASRTRRSSRSRSVDISPTGFVSATGPVLVSPAPAVPTVWLSPGGTLWRSGASLPFAIDGPSAWVEIAAVAGEPRGSLLSAIGPKPVVRRRPGSGRRVPGAVAGPKMERSENGRALSL